VTTECNYVITEGQHQQIWLIDTTPHNVVQSIVDHVGHLSYEQFNICTN